MPCSYLNKVCRVVISALLLVICSGFTIVHHTCTMRGKTCCAMMPSGGQMDPPGMHNEALISRASAPCCRNTISGGRSNLIALLAKQTQPKAQKPKLEVMHVNFLTCQIHVATDIQYAIQSIQTESPPAVVKYLLFASFLI